MKVILKRDEFNELNKEYEVHHIEQDKYGNKKIYLNQHRWVAPSLIEKYIEGENMKTTIYELLGMIKNNNAPKKIMYESKVYHYADEFKDYVFDGSYFLISDEFEKHYGITAYLNDEVTILETTTTYTPPSTWTTFIKEDEKWKPIKILPLITERVGKRAEQVYSYKHKFRWLIQDIRNMNDKMNEIIEALDER